MKIAPLPLSLLLSFPLAFSLCQLLLSLPLLFFISLYNFSSCDLFCISFFFPIVSSLKKIVCYFESFILELGGERRGRKRERMRGDENIGREKNAILLFSTHFHRVFIFVILGPRVYFFFFFFKYILLKILDPACLKNLPYLCLHKRGEEDLYYYSNS